MMTIGELTKKYGSEMDYLDIELLVANSLKKTREFILIHPEFEIPSLKLKEINSNLSRRMRGEPIAYILGRKEFYGLDFIVNKHTLVPRPETELMVDDALDVLGSMTHNNNVVIDVGTGSGCIITALAHNIKQKELKNENSFFATDISKGALRVAKANARNHSLNKKIKFMESSLLSVFMQYQKYKIFKPKSSSGRSANIIITANLPYLSREVYASTPIDVKKFEPKSALYSPEHGLKHYRRLLEQTKKIIEEVHPRTVTLFLEISPEQKQLLAKLIKSIFTSAKTEFKKDLANKWRLCKISI